MGMSRSSCIPVTAAPLQRTVRHRHACRGQLQHGPDGDAARGLCRWGNSLLRSRHRTDDSTNEPYLLAAGDLSHTLLVKSQGHFGSLVACKQDRGMQVELCQQLPVSKTQFLARNFLSLFIPTQHRGAAVQVDNARSL